MFSRRFTSPEPLEARIAPANAFPTIVNPLPDIVAGIDRDGTVVDLSKIFDGGAESPNRTVIKITTNFDADKNTEGVQGDIFIELFDDVTPLTVQNFLDYALSGDPQANYDATFFHRLGSLSANSNSNDVLQGGGFAGKPGDLENVRVGPQLHNEYSDLDPNERGTISMAKTATGPNSATSQFFINIADNSTALGAGNNGGFTVFGRILDMPGVIDGMDVVDAMTLLPRAEILEDSGQLAPLQDYTAGTTPTAKNLIRITDVHLVEKPAGDTSGLTYTIKSINNLQGSASPVVTGSLSGSQLNLKYVPGQVGVAEVTVQITRGTEVVDETFLVKVQPNLLSDVIKDKFELAVVPGEKKEVTIQVTNSGGATASGPVKVQFFLAAFEKVGNRFERVEPLERTDLGSFITNLNLASGDRMKLRHDLQLPADLSLPANAVYQICVEVTPEAGFNGQELFSDDNQGLNGDLHQVHNRFGDFKTTEAGKRKDAVLIYQEPDGDLVQFSFEGPGAGELVKTSGGAVDLLLTGTTGKTKVLAKVIGGTGDISLRNVSSAGPLGNARFGRIDITGNLAFSGGLRSLKLDDVTGSSTLSIGLFAANEEQRANVVLGRVQDLSLDSTMPIELLKAEQWLDEDSGQETIAAPALKTLSITGGDSARGDLEADVDISRRKFTGSFKVAGLVNGSEIRLSGNVGSVLVGGMIDSSFLVGANDRPETRDDFTALRTVSQFAITGVDGVAQVFVNSTVAAGTFEDIFIRGVDTESGTDTFGVVANVIEKYSRAGGQTLTDLRSAGLIVDEAGKYRVEIL